MRTSTTTRLALLLCALLAACRHAPLAPETQPDEVISALDLAYPPPVGGDAAAATLDVYYVSDDRPKRLLVFVHGGSWVGGDKSNLRKAPSLVPWFTDRGYVVAALDFRLATPLGGAGDVTYADQASDVAFALSWLRKNGATYGVSESDPVLMGYSSGAHLVALLAADERYLRSAGLSRDDLAASISLDVHAYDVPYALELMDGSEIARNKPLIEWLFGTTTDEQQRASPAAYVTSAPMPPTLLVSADPSTKEGSKGRIAALAGARYRDLLAGNAHSASHVHFDDQTHASLVMGFGRPDHSPTAVVAAFLDEGSY